MYLDLFNASGDNLVILSFIQEIILLRIRNIKANMNIYLYINVISNIYYKDMFLVKWKKGLLVPTSPDEIKTGFISNLTYFINKTK